MAPEVLLGGRGDARSDVWSLGVLLYELVNGYLPFSGRTAFETSSAILGESSKPMTRGVPLPLRLVIERCLTKNPDERYQRAAGVRAALQAIVARRPWPIIGRWLIPSRRKGLRIAIAAALVALAIFAAITLAKRSTPSFDTIALLPLENSTGQPAEDFFASGMTDALIAQLGAAGDLRVISRTSAMRAGSSGRTTLENGRQLGADAIVKGSVRRSSRLIHLELRLVEPESGTVIWSKTFERSSREVLVLQAEAVRGLAGAVRSALRPGASERLTMVPAIDPDVYEAHLKGRYEWNLRTAASLELAIQHFNRALELDPAYAPAHAALADCYNQLGTEMVGVGSPREYRPRAEAEAIRALQIDGNSSEAHAALGYVRHYQWQWAEAETSFLRAIELNPSNALARLWYANLLMSRARFDESLRQAYAARDLDPFSLIVNTNIGWVLHSARRYQEAIDHLTRTVALDPTYPQARRRLAGALASAGRYDEALAQVDELLRLTNRSPSSLTMLAGVYARAGRNEEARAVLRELFAMADQQFVPPGTIGAVYSAMGETDTAVEWVERSYEAGSNAVAYLATEPWNDGMRSHPRFQSLLWRTGQQ
jgi:TolB-like protein/tetratricopeptide (TPR) repeat protein